MSLTNLISVTLLAIITHNSESKKIILFVPGISNSHVLFAQRFATSMAETGDHQVTLWNLQYTDIKNYTMPSDRIQQLTVHWDSGRDFVAFQNNTIYKEMTFVEFMLSSEDWVESWVAMCPEQLNMNEEIMSLRAEQFDLAILPTFDACFLAIAEELQVKSKILNMVGTYVLVTAAVMQGVDSNPSYIPNFFLKADDDRMTFEARLGNAFMYLTSIAGLYVSDGMEYRQNAIYQSPPDEDRPHILWDIGVNANGIVINGNGMIDYPRPMYHHVQFIGQLHSNKDEKKQGKDDKLDAEWIAEVEDPNYDGIIVVSFGTVADTKYMPHEMKMGMLNMMKLLPKYKFIWRFEVDLPEAVDVPNVHLTKWLPQKQLLNHPRCVLFITHGGYNSLLESAQSGTPIVLVPFFGDQYQNVWRAFRLGLGVQVSKMEIQQPDVMYDAVNTVLQDKRYTLSARHLHRMISDSVAPDHLVFEKFIWKVAKPHFRRFHDLRRIATKSWMQMYCLDVIAFWLTLVMIILYVMIRLGFAIESKKIILFVPGISNSHVLFAQRFATSMAETGDHQVTLWNLQYTDIKNYTIPSERIQQLTVHWDSGRDMAAFQRESMFKEVNFLQFAIANQDWAESWVVKCSEQLNLNKAIMRLRAEQFDLAILPTFDACFLAIAEEIQVKSKIMSMVGTYIHDTAAVMQAVDANPSYIPNFFTKSSDDRMPFRGRMSNMIMQFLLTAGLYREGGIEFRQNQFYQSPPDEDRPHLIWDVGVNANGIVINGNGMIDYPRPMYHHVQFIGQLHSNKDEKKQGKDDKLNAEWVSIVEDPKYDGIIVVSFGTVAQTEYMPHEMKMGMLNMMKRLPTYKFIWRFEVDFPEAVDAPNVHLTKWLPQKQLLHHPGCVLFITHGGYNSLLESAQSGIPIVLVPFFGDQYQNVWRALRLGLGVQVNKMDIQKPDVMYDAVNTVLQDKRYSLSARHLHRMISDSVAPDHLVFEKFIWKVAKPHFRRFHDLRRIATKSWMQMYCLDVIAFWLNLVMILLYVMIRLGFAIGKKFGC